MRLSRTCTRPQNNKQLEYKPETRTGVQTALSGFHFGHVAALAWVRLILGSAVFFVMLFCLILKLLLALILSLMSFLLRPLLWGILLEVIRLT